MKILATKLFFNLREIKRREMVNRMKTAAPGAFKGEERVYNNTAMQVARDPKTILEII